nr:YcbK family protein [Vibrio sp. SS-MA-C1-2]
MDQNKRKWLIRASMLTGLAMLPMTKAFSSPISRKLTLHNVNTLENISTTYYLDGNYNNRELSKLDTFCRDHRRNEQSHMDEKLFDQIARIQAYLGVQREVYVISAYRSPETNKAKRAQSKSVAKKSYHMKGQAMDISIDGVALSKVHEAALELKMGGVGYYPNSNFIHIDTGPVRSWRG